jgi:hypothetical protein
MKLSSCFRLWGPTADAMPRRRQVPDWVDACGAEPAAAPADAGPPQGCGWFDSSHDLNAGLQVTEHLTPQAVADAVPLGWWLDWQTVGGCGSARSGGAH